MTASQEPPNPLRPYYIPPSIGLSPETDSSATGASTYGLGIKHGSASSYASSVFSDIDYSEYLSDTSPSSIETVRKFLDELMYKYITIILAQPFEVGKVVLQVKDNGTRKSVTPIAAAEAVRQNTSNYQDAAYNAVGDRAQHQMRSLLTYSRLTDMTILTAMSLHTSHPLPLRQVHTPLLGLGGEERAIKPMDIMNRYRILLRRNNYFLSVRIRFLK